MAVGDGDDAVGDGITVGVGDCAGADWQPASASKITTTIEVKTLLQTFNLIILLTIPFQIIDIKTVRELSFPGNYTGRKSCRMTLTIATTISHNGLRDINLDA